MIAEASKKARKMGANTITGVRFETTFATGAGNTGDVAFYGTAMAVKR